MYFLPEQVAEYYRRRAGASRILQLDLFVVDEANAIQWLKRELLAKPQTMPEIHPNFMQQIAGWEKHKEPLELSDLLRQNFLCYDGLGEVPSQVHSYLSSNYKELRNLSKTDAGLREKATGRWYVPDPNKAGDLGSFGKRVCSRNSRSTGHQAAQLEGLPYRGGPRRFQVRLRSARTTRPSSRWRRKCRRACSRKTRSC